MDGKVFLITNIGEVEYHRKTEKRLSHLANDGTSTGNDNFWEMIMQGYFGIIESHGSITINNKGG